MFRSLEAQLGLLATLVAASLCMSDKALAQIAPPVDPYEGNTRLFVLTDIGNEPDDQMSLVRLLLYSNEVDIEGLAAVTSTWLRKATNPQAINTIVAAYGQVRANLLRHANGWPEERMLQQAVSSGPVGYGLAAIDPKAPSAAALALIAAADREDARPLWVSVWGGANVLAEALRRVRDTRSPAQLEAFVSKLRIYSISDQDDAGPWIRREFPKLFYIVSPSLPDSQSYASATWTGISGDYFYLNGDGADGSRITNAWLDAHVRKGPLGAHYPKFEFIMEGDTPAFLGLTGNGLASRQSPSWGGWGGRYVYRQPYGESRAIWTQGGALQFGADSRDAVRGVEGQVQRSDQATIWRWRNAFQNDFAARMDWTIRAREKANHHPTVVINGQAGHAPLMIEAQSGKAVLLNASSSSDPDPGQRLRYRWYHYAEAGTGLGPLADVTINGGSASRAEVRADALCRPYMPGKTIPCRSGTAHVILEVTDNGSPELTSYRRVVIRFSSKP